MKIAQLLVVACIVLAGCTTAQMEHRVQGIEAPTITPRYTMPGHYFTTETVAKNAGLDEFSAHELAVFSVAPDYFSMQFAAVPVAFWGVFYWPYRQRVMATLHSLHNGGNAEVLDRRNRLTAIVERFEPQSDVDRWKLGFVIHAMGDSYAHVHGTEGHLQAFNGVYGHGFEGLFGRDPDKLDANNIPRFLQFAERLFCALSRPNQTTAGGREAFNAWARNIRNGRVPKEYDGEFKLSDLDVSSARQKLGFWTVNDFLMELDGKLKGPNTLGVPRCPEPAQVAVP